jgi:uncharacterized protein YbjT (DUF2867 family)
MQGLLVFRSSIASTGKFFAAAGDAKVSVVDVRDIAGAAASLSLPGGLCASLFLTRESETGGRTASRSENLNSN